MAQDAIHLLFDVEGGEKLTEGSGAEILRQLSGIVDEINRGNHLPKIQVKFDADEAITELRRQLEGLSASSSHPIFGGISEQLGEISRNTKPLEDLNAIFYGVIRAIGETHKKLEWIFEAIPEGTAGAESSISRVTECVSGLVDQIGNLATIVEEISSRPSGVVNHIVGDGVAEDATKIKLMKDQARELLKVYDEMYTIFSSNYQRLKSVPGGLEKIQSLSNALGRANEGLIDSKAAISSATTSAEIDQVTSLYEELTHAMIGAFKTLKVKFPAPDLSGLKAANQAIREYKEIHSEPVPDSAAQAEGQSILDTAKTINEALHSIEEVLASVRAKIEATFDFSTVDTKTEALKEKLEELATISAKIKRVAVPKEKSGNSGAREALDEANLIKEQTAKAWEDYYKARGDKTQAQIDKEIQAAWRAYEAEKQLEERELDERGKRQMRAYDIERSASERRSKEEIDRRRKVEKEIQAAQDESAAKARKRDESEQKEKSNRIKSLVNEYYKLQKELEKAATRDSSISDVDGNLVEGKTNNVYKRRIQLLKAIKEQLEGIQLSTPGTDGKLPLGFSVDPKVVADGAKKLGISAEQYKTILDDIQKKSRELSADHERNMTASAGQWDRNRDKALRYLEDLKDRGADSNDSVKDLMQDLEEIARTGNAGSLNDLTAKMQRLRDEVTKSGADIETWGHKLTKTLGGKVRGALAGAVLAQFTKFTHDVYTNVVNLNKSLVDLQIATGKNKESVEDLIRTYSKLGKQLGATTQEVATAADTWLRQGYSVNETKELLKNTMMLSKLGQIESAEAATALTSSMKGYNVEAEKSIDIVDKLTAVDMEAAASAGGIAVAMAETATGARIAGISMDTLIGYIATVKEVTQDADESVGTFYRTLFARMNNVAAGRFIDDETGESLNDVETVLRKVGIALRDVDGQFRSSGAVIDEVGRRWKEFNTVEQHAIATAMAGSRQQEKLIALMENYGDAVKYAEVATESSGTANEKYGAYLEGIEGKIDSLKAVTEDLSLSILDSDLITGGLSILTGTLEVVSSLVNKLGGLNTALFVTAGVLTTIKASKILDFVSKTQKRIKGVTDVVSEFIDAFKYAKKYGATTTQALEAGFLSVSSAASVAQISIGAVTAVLGILLVTINAVQQAQEEKLNKTLDNAQAHLQEAEAARDDAIALEELIKQYKELADQKGYTWSGEALQTIREIQDDIVALVDDQATAIDIVNGELDDQLGILKDISNERREMARQEAVGALTEAEFAIEDLVDYNQRNESQEDAWYKLGEYEEGATYGNIAIERMRLFKNWYSGNLEDYATIKYDFDSADEFAKQYEAVLAYRASISEDVKSGRISREWYDELSAFINYYKDVYDKYISARDLVEELSEVPVADKVDPLIGNTAELKTSLQILNEIQKGYDGLSKALADATAEGYITAETFATLCELEEEGALAGLKLEDVLVRNANGYKIQADSLKKYVEVLIQQYKIESQYAGTDDKRNAIANLENLRTVLGMLMLMQEDVNDATEAYREELEAQQDMLDGRLDKFGELIDIRKDLLQTYQDEVEYQRELEKRQRNVSQLQTKLSVARLDTSAAGRARVRELEAELKEAQEDLEDYTLEHAIDVLTRRLDSQYAEYEAFIKGKLDEIAALLEQINKDSEEPEDNDMSWVKGVILEITNAIQESKKPDVGTSNVHIPNSSAHDDLSEDVVANPFDSPYGYSSTNELQSHNAASNTRGALVSLPSDEFAKFPEFDSIYIPPQFENSPFDYINPLEKNEFNAPLVEIRCDTVTSEAMPKLESVVNEAVQEIQRQLDSGMSRAGFKRQPTRRLI